MSRELRELAQAIRWQSLVAMWKAGSGHPGGSLSAADILAFICSQELAWQEGLGNSRSRFVLSKGHACPALYAAAAELGLIEHSQLLRFRQIGSILQGHPSVLDTPWVEASTGSLGQGFSAAIGLALGFRHQDVQARIFTLLGDGELQEGQVWEAAMFSSHYRLDNLCAVIDYNKLQSDDLNQRIMNIEPVAEKWSSFGWAVLEIDGHSFKEMKAAFKSAAATKGMPTVVIAHTIKGKGVSYMEGSPLWHGSVRLSDEQLREALLELGCDGQLIGKCLNGTIWQEQRT